jgi:hypothetical protein
MPDPELADQPWLRYAPTRESEGFSFPEAHRDYALMRFLHDGILRHAGGYQKFRGDIPRLLRKAIDEVIDAARSRRYTLAEIEKTEKTYIGTKIEILVRNHLGIERGEILDLSIDGVEVDIKNTVRLAWTIPNEALGHPCILISANEASARCSFGLIVIRPDILNRGRNRDQKTTINAAGLRNAHWLLRDYPYPPNFWQDLPSNDRVSITKPRGGTDRAAMLFRLYQRRPIPRTVVDALAQQKDPMRRLRQNGGARDSFRREGIALLSGMYDQALIELLGLPHCARDEFISVSPETPTERALLIERGKLS